MCYIVHSKTNNKHITVIPKPSVEILLCGALALLLRKGRILL